VKPFPVAAGLSMLMPIPFWDLLLEKMVLHQMIIKVCAEHGLVVSEGTCFRLSGDLVNGVMGQQLSGKALKLFNLYLYIAGGIVLNALMAAGLVSFFEHVIRTHLQEKNDINSLTKEKVRTIFLDSLTKPKFFMN
jgi:uncharacterized protein (DUF697 family)